MIIDCISDLHGYHPELEGGDLLIVAGDLTACDRDYQYDEFYEWLFHQNYLGIVFIAGNHDGKIQLIKHRTSSIQYLFDSCTEFQGLKIWGSPWTPTFFNWHFMKDRGEDIRKQWDLIPDDIDILITHGPPYGIRDGIKEYGKDKPRRTGCMDLTDTLPRLKKLKLHVFGHIHQGYGLEEIGGVKYVNASHCNEVYDPVNKPIRIILD